VQAARCVLEQPSKGLVNEDLAGHQLLEDARQHRFEQRLVFKSNDNEATITEFTGPGAQS
jgi:hypothetical protein